MPIFRRTRVVVNRRAQLRIAFDLLLHIAIFFTLLASVVYLGPLIKVFSSKPVATHHALAEGFLKINAASWPFFLLIVIVIIFLSFIWSNRIIGPIYRLRKIFEALVARNLSGPIGFRKKDFHQELQPLCRNFIKQLRDDVALAKSSFSELEESLSNSDNLPPKAQEQLGKIKDILWAYQTEEEE